MQDHRPIRPATSTRRITFAVCLLFTLFGAASKAFAQNYSLQVLGALDGTESEAKKINNLGQVIGDFGTGSNAPPHMAFFYSNGSMIPIPSTLGGDYTLAGGINDLGQVTGGATEAGNVDMHIFMWANGVTTDLGTLPGEKTETGVGRGINNLGTIVGESKAEGFIYEDNQMKGFSRRGAHAAWDINNWGVIVGELNNQHAFIFDQKNMIDLGTLDGGQKSVSYATAINDSGKVVGYSTSNDGGSTHAFLYENGVMHDLGTLHGGYSVAMGINNLGAIVGHSDGVAFIYENGQMKDLNDLMMPTGSFAYLSVAQDINDAGQVVGRVFTPEGQRGFIVTPAD